MPTCPSGHGSASTEICDICGIPMDGADAALAPSAESPAAESPAAESPAAESPAAESLAAPDAGPGPGAEVSGVVAPAAAEGEAATGSGDGAAAAGWTAVVTADRGYYDSVIAEGGPDAASIEFPHYCPERRFRLNGREMRIGRRSASRGLEPEIDLSGPPVDPGVSHLHAVLIAEPNGTWAVLDPGSANGTILNSGEIVTGVRVPLHDGDRLCVGAWTVLTIRALPAG